MRVRDLQQILGKFTDGEKGTNISDCPIYIETKDGYMEEVRFIELQKSKINRFTRTSKNCFKTRKPTKV